MTALEAYKRFLLKIDKNDTNRNINISKGNFVLIFNEQISFWLKDKIKNNENSSEKNDISEFLLHDIELEKLRDREKFSEFQLPSDFFEYEASHSIAKKGKCKERILYNWDFKAKNKNALFQDENNNPSFEYEQTLINLSQNKLIVFKEDFDVIKQYLTYYRQPNSIDLDGYIKVDGTSSRNIDPEISDMFVNEIINRCSIEVIRNYGNTEDFQLANDRIIK